MLRAHILQLPDGGIAGIDEIDFRSASKAIGVIAHKVAIVMLPAPEKYGALYLPSGVAGNCRADVGVVVASPHPEAICIRGVWVGFPAVGSVVAVWPEDGVWIENPEMGSYRGGQLRVYGVFVSEDGGVQTCDYWDSILFEMKDDSMIPFGDKILLRKDPLVTMDGSVHLPDSVHARSGMATVVAVGPLEHDVRPQDRVCYSSPMLLENGLSLGDTDLAICDNRAILYRIIGK